MREAPTLATGDGRVRDCRRTTKKQLVNSRFWRLRGHRGQSGSSRVPGLVGAFRPLGSLGAFRPLASFPAARVAQVVPAAQGVPVVRGVPAPPAPPARAGQDRQVRVVSPFRRIRRRRCDIRRDLRIVVLIDLRPGLPRRSVPLLWYRSVPSPPAPYSFPIRSLRINARFHQVFSSSPGRVTFLASLSALRSIASRSMRTIRTSSARLCAESAWRCRSSAPAWSSSARRWWVSARSRAVARSRVACSWTSRARASCCSLDSTCRGSGSAAERCSITRVSASRSCRWACPALVRACSAPCCSVLARVCCTVARCWAVSARTCD